MVYNHGTGEIRYTTASVGGGGSGGGGGSLTNGSSYSDYLWWDSFNTKWAIGSQEIHIGANAGGMGNQSTAAIAIGRYAGYGQQGANAIAIGNLAGYWDQSANSIVINASGTDLNAPNQGFYVKPIRELAVASPLYYNNNTGEISYASSSQETKTDIQEITSDTLNTLDIYNLVPKTFIYNSHEDAGQQVGYIADEVYNINSNLVTVTGGLLDINWNTIIVFLVEEMKKLKAENAALRVRVNDLDGLD
jgi:hypothetical protein